MQDGCTLRQHAVKEWSDDDFDDYDIPPELAGPECPEACEYIWRWWNAISLRRQGNGFEALPIAHAEVQAWAERMGYAPLTHFEQQALDAIESVYLRVQRKLPPLDEDADDIEQRAADAVSDDDD